MCLNPDQTKITQAVCFALCFGCKNRVFLHLKHSAKKKNDFPHVYSTEMIFFAQKLMQNQSLEVACMVA